MKSFTLKAATLALLFITLKANSQSLSYPIVDTKIHEFTSNTAIIIAPTIGNTFYGQDATYQGNEPSYTDNGDMTITDNVTGLMWEKDMGTKITYADAFTKASNSTLGGYTDWRVPTIKELFSLSLYTGRVFGTTVVTKFIDTNYFNQLIGDISIGEREIDAQTWSATQYTGLTMYGDITVFGMNFVDGRIKGYPKFQPGSNNTNPKTMYFRMVRGNTNYGKNNFVNNNDGTITDTATGLMWQQSDDGVTRDWQNALSYAENLTLANYSDWKLPNIKELQSIVDYSRSPSATNSPAIDPMFSTSTINDPDGNPGHYPYFWSSTTLQDGQNPYVSAAYIPFGKAYGKMNGVLLDTHGAGAMRSDPKTGVASSYPQYFGPQSDAQIVFNNVRCVRTVTPAMGLKENNIHKDFFNVYQNPSFHTININLDDAITTSVQIEIIDTLGRTLYSKENIQATNTVEVNVSGFTKGLYIVRLKTENKVLTKKIVIE